MTPNPQGTLDRRTPDPGSPAAFIAQMLVPALTAGLGAASARFLDWRRGLDRLQYGADVKVAVTYHHDGRPPVEDVVRLDRVWQLADAGATLDHLGCPDEPLPVTYVAAAQVMGSDGVRHDLVVIDRRGGQFALAERAVNDGEEVGKVLRDQVLKYANAAERKRFRDEAKTVGDTSVNLALAAGVADHLAEDPTRRGINQGRPDLQWSYKTVENEVETIVAVSDPDYTLWKLSRVATGGIRWAAPRIHARREVAAESLSPGFNADPDSSTPMYEPEPTSPVYEPVQRSRHDYEMEYARRQNPWEAPDYPDALTEREQIEDRVNGAHLTSREKEVVWLLADDFTPGEVAELLDVSQQAVSKHWLKAKEKMTNVD